MSVVHQTPTLIDPRAFTMFGMNAKPNSANPIGYFGTGLKYAIAVLVREGLTVTVWIGEEPHQFFCEPSNFRGKDFNMIRMRRQRGLTRRWFTENMPYSTELGKNWQVWMALRELHSNTLDENGSSFETFNETKGAQGCTRIVVEGDAYHTEFANLSNTFLSDVINKTQPSQIFANKPTKHAYFRGMRVMDLKRPTLHTYNINDTLLLTEDRTLQHPWMFEHYVKRAIMGSTNESFVRSVFNAPNDTFEHQISWDANDKSYATPEFIKFVTLWGGARHTTVFVDKTAIRTEPTVDWRREVIIALDTDDENEVGKVCLKYKTRLAALLERERVNDKVSDDIPF